MEDPQSCRNWPFSYFLPCHCFTSPVLGSRHHTWNTWDYSFTQGPSDIFENLSLCLQNVSFCPNNLPQQSEKNETDDVHVWRMATRTNERVWGVCVLEWQFTHMWPFQFVILPEGLHSHILSLFSKPQTQSLTLTYMYIYTMCIYCIYNNYYYF